MTDVHTTYDSVQHCIGFKETRAKTVSMDCPYTGKGEEFSPTNLVEVAMGGCMLLAMGAIAMRHDLDLAGARIDVSISATDKPVMRFSAVDAEVIMPAGLSKKERAMLERAAEGCPIKHSFGEDIPVRVSYRYQQQPSPLHVTPQPVLD